MSASRRWAAIAAAGVCVPIFFDLILSSPARLFAYAASDAYYYFDVARHVVHEGRFAFDGQHATNGFHPLWQLALVPMAEVLEALRAAPHQLLRLSALVSALVIGLGVFLIGLSAQRAYRRPSLVLVVAPIGIFGLLLLPTWARATHLGTHVAEPLFGTLWSYVNGMESGLVLLAFALALWFHSRDPRRAGREALTGLAFAALALARLDHAFFGASYLLYEGYLAWRNDEPRRGWQWLACALCFSAPLIVYLAINHRVFGMWVPVSGAMKSSFPSLSTANFERLIACVVHREPYARHVRIQQLVLPALGATGFLVWNAFTRADRVSSFDRFLVPASIATLMLVGYDFCFVDLPHQGYWYVPVPVLLLTLFGISVEARTTLPRSFAPVAIALCISTAVIFTIVERIEGANQAYADFYLKVAPRIRAHYGASVPHLIENDDGIISFATGYPAMSSTGLALDPEAARAWPRAELVPLALARGFDRLTSLVYWPPPTDLSDEAIARFVAEHVTIVDADKLRFSADFSDGSFVIVKIERR